METNMLETLSIKLLQADGCDNKEYETIIDTLEKMSRQETTCRYKEGFSNGKLAEKLIEKHASH